MNAVPSLMAAACAPRLQVEYVTLDRSRDDGSAALAALFARDDTLALLGFGPSAPASDDLLEAWGITPDRVAHLRTTGVLA